MKTVKFITGVSMLCILTTSLFASVVPVSKKKDSQGVCETKSNMTMTCPDGRPLLLGVFTVSYNCETGQIINTDFWQSGRSCDRPVEVLEP